ncbi:MAG: GTP-binding protein [Ruminococcaceae bacterium]|nr:GTP-binding protein [Oscillospiraceae bacterium]
MKRIAAGIVAHVDAGKTTLSEGLLYCAGEIRKLGRVDTQDAFLDTDEMERRRGITIFSKQAVLTVDDTIITLLDTPGHVDFAAEAERTLQVLDYAVLVISATDGVQSHTKTLWEMLERHGIPVFVFINKMDLAGADKGGVVSGLKEELGGNFIDFSTRGDDEFDENIAMCDEELLHEYLETGMVSSEQMARAIRRRNLFPCFCGSALKLEGVEEFLTSFSQFTLQDIPLDGFGARVFKIGRDERGQRLTFMKVTGGTLAVRSSIHTGGDESEKINEIRIYSGEKYRNEDVAQAGCVCAVTGPRQTYAGQGLGFESNASALTAQPIFGYRVILPQGADAAVVLEQFRRLEQEETQLNVEWNEQLKEIRLRLMGEIQLEVLKQQMLNQFGTRVEFEQGRIIYKETITHPVEGVGHYEPLRHYAEVHLLLEPLPRGSGMQFETDCPEDELDKNWQRLILTHLMERQHLGVLTGLPITDIKITLKSGRAHIKHTDGGDFRQATYRAVRHGLRCAESVLLEPYYEFSLEVPAENVGRAMNDLDRMGAEFTMPSTRGETAKITGSAAASAIGDYQKELIGYTRGKGKISCKFSGYGDCINPQTVVEEIGYDCDADIEHTADSVFCAHGAGFNVRWDEVTSYMHLDSVLKPKKQPQPDENGVRGGVSSLASDEELMRIFERAYGKITTRNPNTVLRTPKGEGQKKRVAKPLPEKEYLLIDGYNIIFAWDSLKELARDSLEAARNKLMERLSTYRVFKKCEIILVFDAYKVKGNRGEVQEIDGITVVYTKEAQTADTYIERTAKELSRNYKVIVATSDGPEQMIIFGSGAYRLPARGLEEELERVEKEIRDMLAQYRTEAEREKVLERLKSFADMSSG